MTKSDYLRFRNAHIPTPVKIIFVLESPPVSGRYFYNPDGPISEPLFRAMMKDVVVIAPKSKDEGLKEFAARGYLLIDATYTPVNRLSGKKKKATILRDFDLLVEDLRQYASRHTRIVLVKANVCRLLEQKLIDAGFNVVNRRTMIPFPSTGQQSNFRAAVRQVLGM